MFGQIIQLLLSTAISNIYQKSHFKSEIKFACEN